MKCAIYVRVSRDDLNNENQTIPLVRFARSQGWEFQIFSEKASTRKTRPIQWNLYNRLLKKEFDILLIYKLDRCARSLKELIEHLDNLMNRRIKVISYTENLDFSNAMGKMIFHIIGSFAEFERELIRERTLAGLDRARAKGKKLGRPKKKRGR